MKNPFSNASTADRLLEDELYARVYEEIENGQMDKAAQARAIEEAGGDNDTVKKAYIKHRIARIKLEIEIAKERAAEEYSKARAEEEKERAAAEVDKELKRKEQLKLREDKTRGFDIGAWIFLAAVLLWIVGLEFLMAP